MKYNTNLPNDDINIPKENFLAQMFKLFAVLAVVAFVVYGALKFGLDYAVDNLPPAYEKKIVNLVATTMDIEDLKSDDYLDTLTADLAKCAKLPYDIKTYIIPDTQLNAFALPGGSIYITKGMLKSIKNQNELASVIGHEMGHFKYRHHLKTMGTGLLFSLFTLSLGESYGSVLKTTLDISNIKYSQAAELEADAFALDVMECTYHSVTDATSLFARLDDGKKWSYFFATHPAFKERLKKMKQRINEKGYDTTKAPLPLKKKF